MMEKLDLIVIGSGPGGIRAAIQAAKIGKKVALIEKEKIGGSCVHTGTIPSKSLREAALRGPKRTSFASAMESMREVIRNESKIISSQLSRNSISIIKAKAELATPHSVTLKGRNAPSTLEAKFILIATGTRPIQHEEFPFHLPNVFDSDTLLTLERLPKSLFVLGAGVIGCEYASIFARLGSKVTLADRRRELLRMVDAEIIEALKHEFLANDMKLHLGAEVGLIKKNKGKLEVAINGKKRCFEAALICMGRKGNLEELGLAKAGVQQDQRGNIRVNPQSYQTNIPSIYAVGDVIGPPGLAASAAEQGRIAACSIFGIGAPKFPDSFPSGIYTIPEISSVGEQESSLLEKKIPYVVGKAEYSELARGLMNGSQRGFIKILAHRDSKAILGVHAIGPGATELIHIGQVVHALGAGLDFLVGNVFNYPTYAEAYKVAALRALNQTQIK